MDIQTLDLNFQGIPNLIAAYLLHGPAGYVLIETGPMSTLPTLLDHLANRGLTPADIQNVLVTHIHLDHAGAAGWWARQGAQIYVHTIGQPHLIDPSRLLHSVKRVYGDMMEPLWGEVLPAPADCVTPVEDGMTLELAGLTLQAISTPGHAWHHHTYRLGGIAFCGDAAGVRLNNSPWVSFPAPPPEFNLEAWQQTLDWLEAEDFEALYLTHFGRVEHVQEHLNRVRRTMEEMGEFVRVRMEAGIGRNQLVREYIGHVAAAAQVQGLTEEDWQQYETVIPTFMSVDGIIRYWQRQQEV